MAELSDRAREMKNAYQRAYRIKNPEKIKQHNLSYWERKADPQGVEVRRLSKQGYTQRQIAENLGLSLGTVNRYLNTD